MTPLIVVADSYAQFKSWANSYFPYRSRGIQIERDFLWITSNREQDWDRLLYVERNFLYYCLVPPSDQLQAILDYRYAIRITAMGLK